MKKSKVLIILTLLCCILVINLAACKDPSGDYTDSMTGEEQFNEYRQIATAVLDKLTGKSQSEISVTKLSADSANGKKNEFTKSERLQGVYDYLGAVEDKEISKSDLVNVSALNFVSTLIYGELWNKYGNTDKFYGVPMKIEWGESISPSESYVVVLSKGARKIAYMYGKDEKAGEVVYVYDIDYVNADEFSAKMISLAMDELNVKSSALNASSYYFYGDTDGRSLIMSGIWKAEESYGELLYKATADSSHYSIKDLSIINSCFSKLRVEYDDIDLKLIRSLKNRYEFSVTREQHNEAAYELLARYGLQ